MTLEAAAHQTSSSDILALDILHHLALCRGLPSNRAEEFVCPEGGWTLVETSCFLVTNTSGNWHEGQSFCEGFEASLATVSSDVQQEALTGLFPYRPLSPSSPSSLLPSSLFPILPPALSSFFSPPSHSPLSCPLPFLPSSLPKGKGPHRPFALRFSFFAPLLTGMLTGDTWIGLSDLQGEHEYSWDDGSSVQYLRWAKGEPSNSGSLWIFGDSEDCVEMRQQVGYLWNDAHCEDTKLETTASWTEAKDSCIGLGGVLASITSEDEQAFVSGLLTRSAWIGLSDRNTENEFKWEDECQFNYTSWQEGEPNNHLAFLTFGVGEDCVEMKKEYGYLWNDEGCSSNKAFVCERPAE
ncbi:mannose receptor [Penaeus vannamei]|uniref:Mannose receptor n=1 Tax=Penaeus vannamei TaxID=6689 RepID=A0A3R7QD48_PENVA|nr:mannose receptor [Penaeus vannamei]